MRIGNGSFSSGSARPDGCDEWRVKFSPPIRTAPETSRQDSAAKFLRRFFPEWLPPTPRRALESKAAANRRTVVLFSQALARLNPDLAVLALRISNAPHDEGKEIALDCEINVSVIPVARGLGWGMVRVRIVLQRTGEGAGNFVAAKELLAPAGARIEIDGVGDHMVATLTPSGVGVLRVNGMSGAPIRVGELLSSIVGSGFELKLLASPQSDFVHVRSPPESQKQTASINRKKVLSHFASWQEQIPAETVDIELVNQSWRVKEYQDL